MERKHTYPVTVQWHDRSGRGTSNYRDYDRGHVVSVPGKPDLVGSADPLFRGDPTRWSPEDLLVAALSQCHLLSYLALCAMKGVVVVDYLDQAVGTMVESPRSGGRFTEVTLRPHVTVTDAAMVVPAGRLHDTAHEQCYIASSVAFPVRHEPVILVAD